MPEKKCLWTCVGLAAAVVTCQAAVIRVPQDYRTIQEGINAARDRDTVLVDSGRYTGNGNVNLTLSRQLTLMSVHGPLATVIDGENGNQVRGIAMTANSAIIGFTITRTTYGAVKVDNCNNFLISQCLIVSNTFNVAGNQGCGIILGSSTGRIQNCIIRENSTTNSGAGIYMSGSTASVVDCIIYANACDRFGGGVNATGSSQCDLVNCVFFSNSSGVDGGGITYSTNSRGTITQCTFMDNRAGGGGGGVYKGSNSNPTVVNSIFYGNEATGSGPHLWAQDNGGSITISYSCVEGGPRQGDGWNWDNQTMIDDDPLVFPARRTPVWGVDGFFLDYDSPAVDAGRGTAQENGMDTLTTRRDLQPDTGRVDMGYHYDRDNFLLYGTLRGYVYDAATAGRLEGATVKTSRGDSARTNIQGYWNIPRALIGTLDITASLRGYNDSTVTRELRENDTIRIDFNLLHPEIRYDPDTLGAQVAPGDSAVLDFFISNAGNGPLDWKIKIELPGGANADPWTLRTQYNIGEVTQDRYIEGAVLVNDTFYVSGGGRDTNFVYVLNRNGEVVRYFPQFAEGRTNRLKDLDSDGNLIWGAGYRTVYTFTTNGDLVNAFEGPFNSIQGIAWDSQRELVWLAKTVNPTLEAYDVNGNRIRSVSQNGLRVYGLAFYPEDPAGYQLYILNYPGQPPMRVHKMNPETGDTQFVANLEGVSGQPGGAFITNRMDAYSWVFIAVADTSNRDRIDIWQLAANLTWVSLAPTVEGVIPPQESRDFTLTLRSHGVTLGQTLRGALHISHNAWELDSFIDFWMTVAEPDTNAVAERVPAPKSLELFTAHPNPFNVQTILSYSLPTAAEVNIKVYNLLGGKILDFDLGLMGPGRHRLSLDAGTLPSGVYILRLQAGTQARMTKLVLLR